MRCWRLDTAAGFFVATPLAGAVGAGLFSFVTSPKGKRVDGMMEGGRTILLVLLLLMLLVESLAVRGGEARVKEKLRGAGKPGVGEWRVKRAVNPVAQCANQRRQ